ncbi:hypothetical protein K439DRAFT_1642737, partial [Ramaria rubella]
MCIVRVYERFPQVSLAKCFFFCTSNILSFPIGMSFWWITSIADIELYVHGILIPVHGGLRLELEPEDPTSMPTVRGLQRL